MVRAMCGVLLNDRKRSTNLMFMLGLNKTIDQLAMASCVCLYAHVLRREDGHLLRMGLDIEVESQGKKLGLSRKDALCLPMWIVGIDLNAARFR